MSDKRKKITIGLNLRVTGNCNQGGRRYMEDFFSVAYQQTEDERDLEYAFFGIYDGHGGAEAASYAKEHLMDSIVRNKLFWSRHDDDVLRAIREGFISTHYAMWKEQEKWPKTASGLPSTAGTTASIAFIRKKRIYVGHVGDSGIVLGYKEESSGQWLARPLTRDHKPENVEEMRRINQCGGKVVAKSGVPRVVWNRPRMGHQGPVRRSTPIDEIPFLAVARSLGDLWSYNSQINKFIVSPNPDVAVFRLDTDQHKCLIFGTDGLFNMLSASTAVHIVQYAEKHNEKVALEDSADRTWMNPSKLLVEKALERWHITKLRADNTSVITLLIDPPGPPRAQVLKDLKKNKSVESYPESGLEIMTRFEDEESSSSSNNSSVSENEPLSTSLNEEAAEGEENRPSVSSTESLLPLKEWNSCQKSGKESSSEPKQEVNNKENIIDKYKIQINEISSSSCCDENLNETPSRNQHNLRSTSASNHSKREEEKVVRTGRKRKREREEEEASSSNNNNNSSSNNRELRKSGRIEENKKQSLAQRILNRKKKGRQVAKKTLFAAKSRKVFKKVVESTNLRRRAKGVKRKPSAVKKR